jgi:hypothetical protein
MKIIKRGEIPPTAVNKTCGYCNTEFEYEPSDIKSDRDGFYVICPVCNKFLGLPSLKDTGSH